MADLDWTELAHHLNSRMGCLELTQQRVAEAAGVSRKTVRDLQSGHAKHYRLTTLSHIAGALQWPNDAFVRVLGGLPPVTSAETR